MGNISPIACSLNSEELAERKLLLAELSSYVKERGDLPDGFYYVFGTDSVLEGLARIICAERQCCPFFSFKIEMTSGCDGFRLEITGPSGSREFLPDLFGVF